MGKFYDAYSKIQEIFASCKKKLIIIDSYADNSLVYHCGASINRIGYKTFSINLIQDRYVSLLLINRVKDMLY